MIEIKLNKKTSPLEVLCLGSHADDIEIGCGGTVLKFIQTFDHVVFHWVVFSADEKRSEEAKASANLFLKGAQSSEVIVKNFRDSFFPYIGADIKTFFQEIRQGFSPDVIFTHYRHDLHQDHRLVSELTWNTFRNHLILEYEIPKYDGDLGSPNFFVPMDAAFCREKVSHLLGSFPSQKGNHWFTEETFLSLLRLRGIEANSPTGYAEAFHCRKIVM